MHRVRNQHQAPVLPELPAFWIWFHGGRELQSVAHWNQRRSSLCTVSTFHVTCPLAMFFHLKYNKFHICLKFEMFIIIFIIVIIYLFLMQETISRVMSRHCGRGHFQCLHPKQRRRLICVLFSLLVLPIFLLPVHHQLLLLSQTESTSPRGSFHSPVSTTMPPPFFFCARSFFHPPHPHWLHVPPLCTLRCCTCEQAAEPLLRTFAHVGPRETFSLGTSLNCRKDPCAPDYAYFECEDGNELVSKCSQSFWMMTGIPKQIGRSGESRRDAPTETVVPYISNHSPLKKSLPVSLLCYSNLYSFFKLLHCCSLKSC